eukprot:GFYU01005460.1.p1 GENE.GFYU01005460.1~~GFYU01005460.1.p1  ORF type:complete len:546 (-),score=119.36 GFYU01005460.1:324-1961(-)
MMSPTEEYDAPTSKWNFAGSARGGATAGAGGVGVSGSKQKASNTPERVHKRDNIGSAAGGHSISGSSARISAAPLPATRVSTGLRRSRQAWGVTQPAAVSPSPREPVDFSELPDDVTLEIFRRLQTNDVLAVARVCRDWRRLAYEPELWTRVDLSSVADRLTDDILKRLAKSLKEVKSLNMCGASRVTDVGVTAVLQASGHALSNVNFTRCERLTDKSLVVMAGLNRNLRQFVISSCQKVSDDGMEHVTFNCTSLETVVIGCSNRISDKSVSHVLDNCESLKTLIMSGCERITFDLPDMSPEMAYLTKVDLSWCLRVSSNGVLTLLRVTPFVEDLILCGCRIDDGIGNAFEVACPKYLKALDISWCTKITDASLCQMVDVLPNLQFLNLSECQRITHHALSHVASICTQLRILRLTSCGGVRDVTLQDLAYFCPQLEELSVAWCIHVSDVGVGYLMHVEGGTKLRTLDLRMCHLVTDEAVILMANTARGLHHLYLSGCHKVTNDVVVAVKKSRPSIRIYRKANLKLISAVKKIVNVQRLQSPSRR